MKLKFIGTSSGQTSFNRNHSSLFFQLGSTNILIDAGDGISKALLHQNVDHSLIDNIIISHFHSDHLAGLPSLLTQMIIAKRSKAIEIYTHKSLLKTLLKFLESSFLFTDKYDFKIKLNGFENDKEINISNELKFISKKNSHITNKHNVAIQDLEFMSVSFLFMIKNKNIIYTADIGCNEDLYLFKESNSELFITESTHISLEEIEQFELVQSPKKIILTHINTSDENLISDWHKNLPSYKKEKFVIADDGLEINLI